MSLDNRLKSVQAACLIELAALSEKYNFDIGADVDFDIVLSFANNTGVSNNVVLFNPEILHEKTSDELRAVAAILLND